MVENDFESARQAEHDRCVKLVEEFAVQYVSKWESMTGDRAKAEGWAILQAAADLKRR